MSEAVEKDLESMSMEELEEYIRNENIPEDENKSDSNENSQTVQDNIQGQESTLNSESETTKPDEGNFDDEEPFYKGKQRHEIIEMQKNATRKISQQQNELHKLQKELEEKQRRLEEVNKPQSSDNKQDPYAALSDYDPQDQQAIALIVEKTLATQEEKRRKNEEEKAAQTKMRNEQDYEVISDILVSDYPDKAADIQKAIVDEIVKDPTVLSSDPTWVKTNWRRFLPQKSGTKANTAATETVTRKVRAATVGSGGGQGSSAYSGPKKNIENMDPDEYLDYLDSIGEGIRKK